jgi:hypothetical protein
VKKQRQAVTEISVDQRMRTVKLTLPVGLLPLTVAVKVTLLPAVAGLGALVSVVVVAAALVADRYGVYPPALDGAFHGLVQIFVNASESPSFPTGPTGAGIAYLPVRLGEVRLYQPATPVRTALLTIRRRSERSIQADFRLMDESGAVVATVDTAASTTLTAIVKGTAGGVAPVGSVTFRTGTKTLGDAVLSASGESATATLTVIAAQLSAGINTITAQYAGTPGFSPSTATTKVSVTGAAALIEAVSDQDVVYKQTPDADGFAWHYRIRLADMGGVASVVTDLAIDGTDFSDRIPTMFGSSKLPAFGSLTAALRAKITNTPVEHTYRFGGIDAKGYIWNRDVTIRFLAEQGTAALSLTSTPSNIRLSPTGDPHCSADHPLFHQLNIEERNGIAVKLNRFVADGKDIKSLSDRGERFELPDRSGNIAVDAALAHDVFAGILLDRAVLGVLR